MDHWDDPLEEFRPFEQQEYYVTSLYRMSRLKCSTWIAPLPPGGCGDGAHGTREEHPARLSSMNHLEIECPPDLTERTFLIHFRSWGKFLSFRKT